MLALILYTIQIWMRILQLIKVGILLAIVAVATIAVISTYIYTSLENKIKTTKINSNFFLKFYIGSLAESSCLTDYIIIEGSASTCDLTDTNNRYCGERFADSNGVLEHLEICGM